MAASGFEGFAGNEPRPSAEMFHPRFDPNPVSALQKMPADTGGATPVDVTYNPTSKNIPNSSRNLGLVKRLAAQRTRFGG